MDAKLERSNKGKVLRKVAKLLEPSGFKRSKPTYYTRIRLPVVEFVHLHKYTSTSSFRLHFGIRVVSDPFKAVALNGPTSDELQSIASVLAKRMYSFDFNESDDSVERCALDINDFIASAGETWFKSHRDLERLAISPGSPLSSAARTALVRALAGEVEDHFVWQTRMLLNAP